MKQDYSYLHLGIKPFVRLNQIGDLSILEAKGMRHRAPQIGATTKLADGVYCDVAHRNTNMTLGFGEVKDGIVVKQFSMPSKNTETSFAEKEAILFALGYWLDTVIYSDHKLSIKTVRGFKLTNGEPRVRYVARNKNWLAHGTAHYRKGFVNVYSGIPISDCRTLRRRYIQESSQD